MSLEKDFLMRQFMMLARFLSQVFFKKMMAGQEQVIFYDHSTAKRNEDLSDDLNELVGMGEINEAENRLFQVFEQNPSEENFATAVAFYGKLMQWDEGALRENHFSRDEVGSGFQDICRMYGVVDSG
ncbi:MAG: DUF6483 family protein [Peptococcaceae bacterium]|jgi:hypothetical protein|nr:DUF6483 family protein [Peptococcaceae bacterium]